MDDGITVAIIQRAQYLPRKLSSMLLPQLAMTDNIVKHLSPIDVLKKQVEMTLGNDDVPHSANIRMFK